MNLSEETAGDALEALRDEFEGVEKSALQLREEAREMMLEQAGRSDTNR